MLAEIVTEVRDRTLADPPQEPFNFFDWGDPGSVHVTLPALVALTASGGSDVDNGRHVHGRQACRSSRRAAATSSSTCRRARWTCKLRADRTCA